MISKINKLARFKKGGFMKNYTSITYNAKDFTTDLKKVPKILNRILGIFLGI